MRLEAIFILLLAAAVYAKDDEHDSKSHGKIEFECQNAPWVWDDDGQEYRLECAAELPPGKSGTATFDWQENLGDETRIRSAVLGVAALNGTIYEGENRVSVHTTLLRDDKPVPTCQNKRRVVLTFNRTVPIHVEPKLGVVEEDKPDRHGKKKTRGRWDDYNPGPKGQDGPYEDSYGWGDHGKYDDGYDEYDHKSHRAHYSKIDEVAGSSFDEWDAPEESDAELAAWGEEAKECPHKVGKPIYDSHGDKVDDHDEKDSHDAYTSGSSKVGTSAVPAQGTGNRKQATPGGLRAKVKCKSATDELPSNGNCVVLLRLRVRFTGGFRAVNRLPELQEPAARLVTRDGYTCEQTTFDDTLNVLDTTRLNGGEGPSVNSQGCFAPSSGRAGRKLSQAEAAQIEPAQSGSATIPAGAEWDDVTLARATRAARYTSAIHGCLPTQPTPDGTPRTWEAVAAWGGPPGSPLNEQCRSCFKDGVNYGPGLGGPPVGWETPPFGLPFVGRPFSYRDAAIVLTDTDMIPGVPVVIVLFRATVTAIQPLQWASNVGTCLVRSSNRLPVAPGNTGAGQVCAGWREPVDELNRGFQGFQGLGILRVPQATLNGPATGLMDEVKRRVGALRPNPASQDSPTRIFVLGHSRGGALAATFAGQLLAEQQAGRLYNYVGPSGLRAQVSLYTLGAPSVGDSTFARYLEERMFERFRVINRWDPVVSAPSQDAGYFHWRPSVWFRQSAPFNPLAPLSFRRYCVMTPQDQLSTNLQDCFVSCNDALICPNNGPFTPATAVAGTDVPGNPACDRDTENASRQRALGVAGTVRDHGTYLGVDVNNVDEPNACRRDISVYSAGCLDCRNVDCTVLPPA